MPHLLDLETHIDTRGKLIVIDWFPFTIEREFKICNVPPSEIRGGHAHRKCRQIHIAVVGTVIARLHDGRRGYTYRLSSASVALDVEPMVWGEFEFLPGAVLQVFASHKYDEGDYIRDYYKFLEEAR